MTGLSAVLLLPLAMSAQQAAQPTNSAARAPARTPVLVLDGVHVVDVETGQVRTGQRVVVVGRWIRAVGAARKVSLPRGARVVNAQGKYLIPGLWDMHYHVQDSAATIDYPLLIANGITGIRNPGPSFMLSVPDSVGADSAPRRWQREVAAGTRVGPRQPQQVWALRARSTGLTLKTTPEEIEHGIDSAKAAGAAFLKFSCHGGLGSDDNCTPDVYFALLAAARRNSLHAVGHPPPSGVTLRQGADSGQRTFEHFTHIGVNRQLQGLCEGDSASLAKCHALAQALRRRNAWITPTLSVSWTFPPEFPQHSFRPYDSVVVNTARRWREAITLMQRADMPLLAGTDVNVRSSSVHGELALLVGLGMKPLGALQAATLNPAKYLNATDSLGTVTEGKLADVVLLDADPLADIANTMKIRAVIADGRYYDRAALDALGVEAERLAKQSDRP